MLSVTAPASTGNLTLTWENPANVDVSSVKVSYTDGTANGSATAQALKLIRKCSVSFARYTFTVQVVNTKGATSTGLTFHITWNGAALNAYFIYSAEDLNDIRDGSVTNTYTGYTFTPSAQYNLMADLDLSGYSSWLPIADDTSWNAVFRVTSLLALSKVTAIQ